MALKIQAVQFIHFQNNSWFVFSMEMRNQKGIRLNCGDIPIRQGRIIDLKEVGFEEGENVDLWLKPAMATKLRLVKRVQYTLNQKTCCCKVSGTSLSYKVVLH